MMPTAVSELIEAFCKLAVGIALAAYRCRQISGTVPYNCGLCRDRTYGRRRTVHDIPCRAQSFCSTKAGTLKNFSINAEARTPTRSVRKDNKASYHNCAADNDKLIDNEPYGNDRFDPRSAPSSAGQPYNKSDDSEGSNYGIRKLYKPRRTDVQSSSGSCLSDILLDSAAYLRRARAGRYQACRNDNGIVTQNGGAYRSAVRTRYDSACTSDTQPFLHRSRGDRQRSASSDFSHRPPSSSASLQF